MSVAGNWMCSLCSTGSEKGSVPALGLRSMVSKSIVDLVLAG